MNEETEALKAKLDSFSRRLDARIHEFKTTGELESAMGSLRKRNEAIRIKLDDAIRAGRISDVLKLEFERVFESLVSDLARVEKEFDAAAIRKCAGKPELAWSAGSAPVHDK